jgi:probable rRNA maturation factor
MNIEVTYDHPCLRFPRKETIQTIHGVLRRKKRSVRRVSVVFTNNARIRRINGKHLHHHYVTDVIAFELEERPAPETEIYINLDRARLQAKTYGETFYDEIRRLLIHGLLHVLGYNDKLAKEKVRMRTEEDALLAALRTKRNEK